MPNLCPLCSNSADVFYQSKRQTYYMCCNCQGIFLDAKLLPDDNREVQRYLSHNNDVEDARYQSFVDPIVSNVLRDFPPTAKGLDFGAGTGPVISKLLKDRNYSIMQYDPFFHNHPHLLSAKYNYIACCEVIEHFHSPQKEFSLLKDILLPQGKLYCMTDIYNPTIEFNNWYYKNDPTHVFIYQEETFLWIKGYFGFSNVAIDGRLIMFQK